MKEQQKFLIVDYPVTNTILSFFRDIGLTLLFPEQMTEWIIKWPNWDKFNPEKTLLIFPGNGSQILALHLGQDFLNHWPHRATVNTSRLWCPDVPPHAVGGTLECSYLGFKNVIVLDDVVSSGETIRHLHRLNEPWVPGTSWTAMTWVAQRAASARGIEIFASEWVGTKESKVPINSLSTLVMVQEIADSYRRKHFSTEPMFEVVLEELRGK